MGGGKGGGEADQSGMMQAMVSAQAAERAYQLGEQQLQWTKDVWNQMQPLMSQSEQAQIDLATQQTKSLTQMQEEAQQQWGTYLSTYAPLEGKFVQEAQNWDSPAAIAQARGEAMGSVAEQGMAGINTAAETLRAYGVNPGSEKYASLYTSAQPMLGAAEAAAGTTAANNLRLQKMGLESGAINTGRGMVNTTGSLTQSGTGAGAAGSGSASGAGSTAQGNLNVGSTAMTNPVQWFNSGANNMNTYVNAVDGYNSAQADFAKASAGEMGGFGSVLGTIGGALIGKIAKGGPVQHYAMGGNVAQGIPSSPTDFVGGDERDWLNKANPPTPPPAAAYPGDAKNITTHVHPLRSMPRRSVGLDDGGPTVTYPTGQSQQLVVGPPQYTPLTPAQRQASPDHMGPMYSRTAGRAVLNDPRAAPLADPRTYPAWKRYDDGGPTDPQLTPDQGGGATGIPSAPMPPAQEPAGYASSFAAPEVAGALPADATPGGHVPAWASPSMGRVTDDVPAQLTAGEFVIPKDVAMWKGHEYFAKQLDQARKAQQQFAQRDDVGGEPAMGIPQQPTFVSRPPHMGTTRGAIPGMA